eukprot:5280108-Pyramimonas_sp.AAC.1
MNLEVSSLEDLSPPIRLLYFKSLMKEAARFARNCLLQGARGAHGSSSLLGRIILCRSIGRAVWRQDYRLGSGLISAYPLAARFLGICSTSRRLWLTGPAAFSELLDHLEEQSYFEKLKRLSQTLSRTPDGSERKRLRQRLQRLQKRSRLWAPFDKRLYIRGIRKDDQ